MSRDDYEYEDDDTLDAARGVENYKERNMLAGSMVQKVIAAVAAACVVGGGTVVLNSREKIAVLEYASVQQNAWNQRVEGKLDKIADAVGARE